MPEDTNKGEALLKTIADNIGSMSENVGSIQERLDAAEKAQKEIETKVNNFTKAAVAAGGVSIPGVDETKDTFNWAKAIHGISTGNWEYAGFEKEVFDEARKQKALGTSPDVSGGFFVPEQFVREIIEFLYARTAVIEMGATRLEGLTGSPVEIPKMTGSSSAFWTAERAAISESEITAGQITMQPKELASLTKVSNRLIRLSSPAVEQLIKNDFVRRFALELDITALRGTGAGSQPKGIANTTGISTIPIGANGGEITYDLLVDMITEVEANNADRGKMGFIFHPRVKAKIAKLKDSDGRPLFTWDPSGVQPSGNLIGMPWKATTQLPTNLTKGTGENLSEIYFGNWEDLLIGFWGTMELRASTEAGTSFERNQTWVRAIKECDIAVRHPESFALINDVKTT